jgi:hypothetical protein
MERKLSMKDAMIVIPLPVMVVLQHAQWSLAGRVQGQRRVLVHKCAGIALLHRVKRVMMAMPLQEMVVLQHVLCNLVGLVVAPLVPAIKSVVMELLR